MIGDTVAGADPDPWRLSTLHFYVDQHWLVSTRRRPINCASKLGRAVRGGLAVQTTAELMVWLLNYAADSVSERARRARARHGSDRGRGPGGAHGAGRGSASARPAACGPAAAAGGAAATGRSTGCARGCRPGSSENDRFELLDALDRMETLVDELQAIEQREAGLEAEVAARLSEETNRNLFILSVVTVIFLPMTLITGIFGMNVAGLPGLEDPSAFWWVMLAMAVVPAVFLLAIRWRGRS